ncbi:MAG TPA: 1-deoxy-D-xylulose-5-phosphate reductoisomerase [Thermomicrobiales bacterium]|nr:1-deoxy-D-xylulose-5-phosphate reductoisomerase [Thermomicrobiales bacterium]
MDLGNARQRVAILGSTGSIGRSTLDVIATHPDRFEVVALAASRNAAELEKQAVRYRARYASLERGDIAIDGVTILGGEALTTMATLDDVDIVVVATTGHAAILPTIAALEAGKIVALANKETIVAAGALVMPIARRRPGALRPVDSEHSALWQCLGGHIVDVDTVRRLILTASGGPFRGLTASELRDATPDDALRHPTWDMGAKVTIDSATLMNKGLEVIEAHWLFDMPYDRIDVVVHPQSLVHSLVEYIDGSILAQIGSHDMRLPIQYALAWPDRLPPPAPPLDVLELSRLEFERPNTEVFPMLQLAYDAGKAGSTYPTALSAADSVAVAAFLGRQIGFADMAAVVAGVLDTHRPSDATPTIEAILDADRWATAEAIAVVERIVGSR